MKENAIFAYMSTVFTYLDFWNLNNIAFCLCNVKKKGLPWTIQNHPICKVTKVQDYKPSHRIGSGSGSESHSVLSDSLWPLGFLQARILEWVAFPFSRGSFQLRDQTQVSRIAGGFFTSWTTREAPWNCSDRQKNLLRKEGLGWILQDESWLKECLLWLKMKEQKIIILFTQYLSIWGTTLATSRRCKCD